MKKNHLLYPLFILSFYFLFILNACSKNNGGGNTTPADPCTGKTITVSATVNQGADNCTANGSVTITAAGSAGFTYNVDNGAFQATATFSTLSPGSHTFVAKDKTGCSNSAVTTVPAAAAGPTFTAVRSVLLSNCAVTGCHNGTQAPNYTVDCEIVEYADLIKQRAVDQAGTATQMPQPPRAALAQADQDKITAWISAGRHFAN